MNISKSKRRGWQPEDIENISRNFHDMPVSDNSGILHG